MSSGFGCARCKYVEWGIHAPAKVSFKVAGRIDQEKHQDIFSLCKGCAVEFENWLGSSLFEWIADSDPLRVIQNE
jgi:hypothetical protein